MPETSGLAFDLLRYDTLDSTNAEAKRLLQADRLSRPALIITGSQSAGKGTQGRAWASPQGAGLYASLAHPLPAFGNEDGALTPAFTLAAGVACAESLVALTGLSIHLKPVNDLYVADRKLGGILVEALLRDGQCQGLVTGIGLNVRDHEDIAAACARDRRGNRPTSLQACLPPPVFNQWRDEAIVLELALAFAHAVDAGYRRLSQPHGLTAMLARYEAFKLPGYDWPPEVSRWRDRLPTP